jgi:hypothetical protein
VIPPSIPLTCCVTLKAAHVLKEACIHGIDPLTPFPMLLHLFASILHLYLSENLIIG